MTNSFRSLGCGLLLLATGFLGTAYSKDWPKFRGPSGNGHSDAKNLPLNWGPDLNVVWKTALPGRAWSSPVLADRRIYLTNAIAEGNKEDDRKANRSLRVLSVDADTGKVIWDKEVFQQEGKSAPSIHNKNSHASPTPIVENGKLYVHFGHQGTVCLDLEGKILWRKQELKYAPVHGNGGSPIIVDDHLIFNCDSSKGPFVAALNKKTGNLVWRKPRKSDAKKKFSFSTPALYEHNGAKEVISPGSNVVVAYDPKDGREIWNCRFDGYSVIPKPVIGHGMVFIGTGYDRATLLGIQLGGKGDVTATHLKWENKKRMPHTPASLLIGDELYTVSDGGMVCCMDAKTGDVHWLERSGASQFSACPVYADGRVYLQDEEGVGIVFEPDKKAFKFLAKNDLKERTLASYAVDDGALYIRTQKHLYRIGEGK